MAADVTKATAAKAAKLLERLGEIRDQEGAILRELATLLGGGDGIGVLLKQAEAAFSAAWATRYPGRYVWQYTRDRPQLKRLIQALGLPELEQRFARYIRHEDPFFAKARHNFGAFVASVNQHAAAGTMPGETLLELERAPADCRHQPACRSDVEHTRRQMADVRGEAVSAR